MIELQLKKRTSNEIYSELNSFYKETKEQNQSIACFASILQKISTKLYQQMNEFEDKDKVEYYFNKLIKSFVVQYELYNNNKAKKHLWNVVFHEFEVSNLCLSEQFSLVFNALFRYEQLCVQFEVKLTENDFYMVNRIILSVFQAVEDAMTHISPLKRIPDLIVGSLDKCIHNSDISNLNTELWNQYQSNNASNLGDIEEAVFVLNQRILDKNRKLVKLLMSLVKSVEPRTTVKKIEKIEAINVN